MIKDFIRDEEGGAELGIRKVVFGRECEVDVGGRVDLGMFEEVVASPDTLISLKNPQTFSATLRKMMAFSDEIMNAGDSAVEAVVLTKSSDDGTKVVKKPELD